jgi:hypothetical protein
MILGLPDEVNKSFPYIMPVNRPIIKSIINYDPYWLAGFLLWVGYCLSCLCKACVSESIGKLNGNGSKGGSFRIKIFKAKTKLGLALRLVFQLVQHARDEKLMKSLIVYFGCGNIYKAMMLLLYIK